MDDPIYTLAFEGASLDDLLVAKPGAVFLAAIRHTWVSLYADIQVRLRAPPERAPRRLNSWKLECEAARSDGIHWIRTTLTLHRLNDTRLIGCNAVPPELLALIRPWPKAQYEAKLTEFLQQRKVLAR